MLRASQDSFLSKRASKRDQSYVLLCVSAGWGGPSPRPLRAVPHRCLHTLRLRFERLLFGEIGRRITDLPNCKRSDAPREPHAA